MNRSGPTAWFREKGGIPRVALISGLLFVVSQVAIYLVIRELPPEKLVALQTTFSRAEFLSIIATWKMTGVLDSFKTHFYFDFFHPLWYSIFLASLMAMAFNLNKIAAKYNRLLIIPFLAGFLDLVENSVHVFLLHNIGATTGTKIFVSALAANLKWLLAGVGIVIVVVLLARRVAAGRS
ncbi:MAG: hypothetical protein ACLFPD_10545 [Desulfosudaceae bacterium]